MGRVALSGGENQIVRSDLLGLVRWSVRFFALLGVLAVLVVGTPLAIWLMPPPTGSFDVPAGDTLVVLGSGTNGEFPDLDTYWRCVYAARIFHGSSFQRIVLSGGSSEEGRKPVAEVMAAYLHASGIPADKTLLETSSRSTRENALHVRKLLLEIPAGKTVLLTSDYHTKRAAAAFRRVGLPMDVVIVPYIIKLGDNPAIRPMLLWQMMLERLKFLWYWYKGWV